MAFDKPEDIAIVALAVIGIIFLILVLIAVYFIYKKLRQHEQAIQILEDNFKKFKDEHHMPDKTKQLVPVSKNASVISNELNVIPKMTIRINKETQNVFGHVPLLSQTMMVAQDHYNKTHEFGTTLAVEDVELSETCDGIKEQNERSSIFSDDWKDGKPTSILFNESGETFEELSSLNKGMFVHRTIGPSGGVLRTSGVELNVPADALDAPTLITVGILWDPNFQPHLQRRQSLLSPIILCQKAGNIQFKKAVQLTFPHAAHNVLSDWNVTVLTRNGMLSDESQWKKATDEDFQRTIISNNTIQVMLTHFTLYTCIGESKPNRIAAKVVNLVAFSRRQTIGSQYKSAIYCLNSYKEELATVKNEVAEKSLRPEILEDAKLFIKDNDQDVAIELAKCSEGWSVVGDTIEFLPFELVWHACHPHCTFIQKPSNLNQREIISEFHVYQMGDENKFSKLKISETVTSNDQHEGTEFGKLIEDLAVLLDPVNEVCSDAGDWKVLAEHMNVPTARIRWLQSRASPTKVLLQEWFREEKTLIDLVEMMRVINRPDAVSEIDNYMSSGGVTKQSVVLDEHEDTRTYTVISEL